jgi:hypothetical protein
MGHAANFISADGVKVSKLTGGLASFYPIHIPQQKAALKVPLYSF